MFHYTPQIHTLSINLKYVFYTSKRQSDFFMEEWKRKSPEYDRVAKFINTSIRIMVTINIIITMFPGSYTSIY